MMERREKNLLALLILLLALFSFFASATFHVTGDDAGYLLLARSLANGHGYAGFSPMGYLAETQYPPLFSALLVPFVKFADSPAGAVMGARIVIALMNGLILLPLFFLTARLRDRRAAWMVLLLFTFSPLGLTYGSKVLTEVPFALLAILALFFFVRYEEEGRGSSLALCLLAVVAAWYTRSVGLALAAAVILRLFFTGRMKTSVASGVIVAAAMLPWILRPRLLGTHGSYLKEHVFLRDIYNPAAGGLGIWEIPLRILKSLAIYALKLLPDTLLNPVLESVYRGDPLFFVKIFLGAVLALLVAAGFIRCARRRFTIIETYVLLHGALILIHPVQSSRYLHPVLPFLLLYLLAGGTGVIQKVLCDTEASLVSRGWGLVWVVIGLVLTGIFVSGVWFASPSREWRAYYESCGWIEENTAPDAVIICRKPRVVMWETRRPAESYPMVPVNNSFRRWDEFARASEVYILRDDFVIGVHSAARYLDPVIERRRDRMDLRFTAPSNSAVTLYAYHPQEKESRP